ncbi:uncharacterized protein [Euwallacea fornicatus]|uniref:uncharacterized protein isoform X1 n=1 Tax=Euwallacea fornicatus TaxID=995702 RepID=UPI00338E9C14
MDSVGYEGDDFNHPIEPMVIINSQEDEEDHFFRLLNLSRKRPFIRKTQLSAADQFASHLKFLKNMMPPRLEMSDSYIKLEKDVSSESPEITICPVNKGLSKKRVVRSSFKIKLNGHDYCSEPKEDCKLRKRNNGVAARAASSKTPVRLIPKDEAMTEPYAKRKSSPLEKCPICKKYFRRMKTHLLKHEIMQNQEACSGLICEFCNKAFNSQSNLQIHMRTHTGDKPYVCEVCNKSFSQSCNLVNHIRTHTGEKPFKCPHCDRAFTQSGNLNNHIRLHTDEKPFKCHFCEKAFVQSGNLSSHVRNNHSVRDSHDGLIAI